MQIANKSYYKVIHTLIVHDYNKQNLRSTIGHFTTHKRLEGKTVNAIIL